MPTPLLAVRDATKSFGGVRALRGASLDLAEGRTLALTGESGSGKSTLLHLIGGLDRPDSGVYVQSFEEANLRELNRELQVDLVQLTSPGPTARPYDHVVSGDPETYAQMTTPRGLGIVASQRAAFEAAEAVCRPMYPRCGCPTRGILCDDERWTFGADMVGVACRAGRCTTFVR